MTTSQENTFLSEIVRGQPIPAGKLAYFRARLADRLYELVLDEYVRLEEEFGFTRAELARRIDRDPAQISRWFGSPGNWTIDTVSDLLLGMGCEPAISIISLSTMNTGSNQSSKPQLPSLKLIQKQFESAQSTNNNCLASRPRPEPSDSFDRQTELPRMVG